MHEFGILLNGRDTKYDEYCSAIKLTSKYGEEFIVNVFNFKLGYSRYCYFELRENKTQQDLFECLVNQSVNQTTSVPAILLFQKEKEYLSPLPNINIIESYLNFDHKVKVHKDSMIYY